MDLDTLRALRKSNNEILIHRGSSTLQPVAHSRELERIQALPRKDGVDLYWPPNVFRPEAIMTLWPEQIEALSNALHCSGLFAPIAVGGGKTLICALLPTVLGRRAVILTKASLVREARKLTEEYARHFYVRADVQWLSYGVLSSSKSSELLEQLAPELIVADECHMLRNKDAARTKRFLRYMRAHPDTLFCGLSGTVTKRSLRDYAHLCGLALRDQSPVPLRWPQVQEWSEALDVPAAGMPVRPAGALATLCDPGEDVRDGFRRRLTESYGVVASAENRVGAELTIRMIATPKSQKIDKQIARLDALWERPDGEVITDAVEYARVKRQIKQGGYYYWQWPNGKPDRAWLDARRAYHSEVRSVLRHRARPGLDSPILLAKAHDTGKIRLDSRDAWLHESARIRQPPSAWTWIDHALVDHAAQWALRAPGVVWCDVVAVASEISRRAGVPLYGPGDGERILAETGRRSIVATIGSHGTGRNLQMFHRALVVAGLPTGSTWEQLLGRHHRAGQTEDVVFEVYDTFAEDLEAARADADYIESTLGNQQRLTIARWL